MSAIAHQVTNFVRACEALHWRLIEGHSLNLEEQDMIEHAAIELLMQAEIRTDIHPGGLGHRVAIRCSKEVE